MSQPNLSGIYSSFDIPDKTARTVFSIRALAPVAMEHQASVQQTGIPPVAVMELHCASNSLERGRETHAASGCFYKYLPLSVIMQANINTYIYIYTYTRPWTNSQHVRDQRNAWGPGAAALPASRILPAPAI